MCELPTVIALLGTAAGLLAGSLAALGTAIALNGGFFSAPGSPAAMATAGGLLTGAIAVLSPVSALVNDYFVCMGATAGCAGELSNFQNALAALITVLGIQAAASFATAGVAWVPWAAQPAMWAILGSLVIQAAVIPSLIVFFNDLVECLEQAATGTATTPLLGVFFVAATGVYVIAAYFYAYHSLPRQRVEG